VTGEDRVVVKARLGNRYRGLDGSAIEVTAIELNTPRLSQRGLAAAVA
jgi:hypothetical protein